MEKEEKGGEGGRAVSEEEKEEEEGGVGVQDIRRGDGSGNGVRDEISAGAAVSVCWMGCCNVLTKKQNIPPRFGACGTIGTPPSYGVQINSRGYCLTFRATPHLNSSASFSLVNKSSDIHNPCMTFPI